MLASAAWLASTIWKRAATRPCRDLALGVVRVRSDCVVRRLFCGGNDRRASPLDCADRQAKPPERRELRSGEAPGQREEPQGPHARIDQRRGEQNGAHERLRQRRGEAGADNSERRHAELAEDQSIIGKGVERDGQKSRDKRWARTLERGKRGPRRIVYEARRQAPLESSEINRGIPSDVPRLADREQERARADESDPHDDGEEDRKNKRLVRRTP
jgi:hypothetical protein